MRYFYTSPLAAAWMAHHFGLAFEDRQGRAIPDREIVLLGSGHARSYVQKDSLRLLLPRIGDIYVSPSAHSPRVYKHSLMDDYLMKNGKIIYRNNTPFISPEKE